ncbi:MAG: alpha/beta hydrolase [Henriciella sp.]
MDTRYLVDPELEQGLDLFPELHITADKVLPIRESMNLMFAPVVEGPNPQNRQEIHIPGLNADDPPIRCLLYKPNNLSSTVPAYLHFHGGGFFMGLPEMEDERNSRLAGALGVIVLSVDYRLSPENTAPAALNDALAGLKWLHENVRDLGVDRDRIAVGGESAGAGLAAALSQRVAPCDKYPICFQCLTYPPLDDRTGGEEQLSDPFTGEFVWTRENNRAVWAFYLGNAEPCAPYVPSRATSFSDLPATWIGVGALDLLREENVCYAQNLWKAGIATELIVYPGAYHGFQLVADARVAKRYFEDHYSALKRALFP